MSSLRITDPDFHFMADPDTDTAPHQGVANLRPLAYTDPPGLQYEPPFWASEVLFWASKALDLTLRRMLIQLFILMRIRIQLPGTMWIPGSATLLETLQQCTVIPRLVQYGAVQGIEEGRGIWHLRMLDAKLPSCMNFWTCSDNSIRYLSFLRRTGWI